MTNTLNTNKQLHLKFNGDNVDTGVLSTTVVSANYLSPTSYYKLDSDGLDFSGNDLHILSINKLSSIDSFPRYSSYCCSFSHDSTYLAVGYSTYSPFVVIYKRSGNDFVKLSNPSDLPTGRVTGCSFSHDSTYLALSHETNPRITIYKRSGDTFTKLSNPADLPAGNATGCSFSHDSTYLAVSHSTSPYITIYKRSGDTFAKLSNPANLPSSNSTNCTFSHDSAYLAVTETSTPYLSIYKRSSDTFTKLSNPANLPAGSATGCSFSHDSTYLAISHSNSPYVTIYKRSVDTFTKLDNPAILPSNNAKGCSFSHDSTYLAVSYLSSSYMTIYRRVDDDFVKLTNISSYPTSNGWSCSFSHDSKYLSITTQSYPYLFVYNLTTDIETGTFTSGINENCVQYDGTEEGFNIPNQESYLSTTGAISFWVYVNNFRLSEIVKFYGEAPLLYLDSSGKLKMSWAPTTTGDIIESDSYSLTTNAWNHIILTWSFTEEKWKLYINSTKVEEGTTLNQAIYSIKTSTTYDDSIKVISTDGTKNYLAGKIDDIKTFDTYLTDDEVLQEYNEGINGKLNFCRYFNGTNQYLDTGLTTTSLNFSNWTEFTMSCWVKSVEGTFVYNKALFGNLRWSTAVNNIGGLYISSSNKYSFRLSDGTNNRVVYSTNFVRDVWTHIVGVWDGTKLLLYENGILQGESTSITSINNIADRKFLVGVNYSENDNFFKGYIDDLRFYDKALTSSEINQLYNNNAGNERFNSVTFEQIAKGKTYTYATITSGNQTSMSFYLSANDEIQYIPVGLKTELTIDTAYDTNLLATGTESISKALNRVNSKNIVQPAIKVKFE